MVHVLGLFLIKRFINNLKINAFSVVIKLEDSLAKIF